MQCKALPNNPTFPQAFWAGLRSFWVSLGNHKTSGWLIYKKLGGSGCFNRLFMRYANCTNASWISIMPHTNNNLIFTVGSLGN